ncbi:surface attachment protein Sap1 [Caballeronia sp. S22]|uniref:surface attachment protein Sap1 n=1 Tax=Caballeronia sp. S22 TaxID=3137182 RepID=UPI003530818D
MQKRVGTLFAMMGLCAVVSTAQAQDSVIQAQQTFTFRPNSYGCLSKDKFDSADQHAKAGEHQQMQQFFEGFECISTPVDSHFRVIRVVGHDVEFVNAANSDTQGMWTADRFIDQ